MAITYASTPLVRPASGPSGKLPLVLRNPQNDNTKHDYIKDGVTPVVKLSATSYVAYMEGVWDNGGSNSNRAIRLTGPNGYTWTKDYTNELTPSGGWENVVVCGDSLFYDIRTREWRLYYHAGIDTGLTQEGLMTSQDLLTWSRYSGNPVITNGAGGSWNSLQSANMCVRQLSANSYLAIGIGSDGTTKQIGRWTSADGLAWTPDAGNPVFPLGSAGQNDDKRLDGGYFTVDELNRLHLFYCGAKVSDGLQRILYAYSDDLGVTYTRNAADILLNTNPGGGAGDPDVEIGDMFNGWIDDGLIWFIQQNFNAAGYTGDALGRLEGRGQYWLPDKAATTPTRPGRCFRPVIGTSRPYLTIPAGAKLLQEATAFSLWMDFKIPPGNVANRWLYFEEAAFNKEVNILMDGTGTVRGWYRTPSGLVSITSASRYDDNGWHRLLFRRTGASAFSLYVDGVSVGTSSIAAGSDATALTFFSIGGVDPAETAETSTSVPVGAGGLIRRVVTITGYAMTDAEELTLWNSGNAGGAAPSGGTLQLNLRLGSGGVSGPDVDDSSNAYSCTVTVAEMVNAADSSTVVLGPLSATWMPHTHAVGGGGWTAQPSGASQ